MNLSCTRTLSTCALVLGLSLAAALPERALASNPGELAVAYRALQIPASHRDHALEGALWYPSTDAGEPVSMHGNAVFEPVIARVDAAPADGRWPVVLLSHGLGGHHRTLSWLAAGLVARGAIVVALDHPHSTYGHNDMRRGLDHGTRVEDLSAALDWLLEERILGDRVDSARLYAAGFSFGGWTALSMGGTRGNLAGYASHCQEVGEASSHCADIARAGVALDTLDPARWNADYRDARIAGVAAIDPGLVYGLRQSDVAGSVDVVQLISLGAGDDRLLATDYDRAGLPDRLPAADSVNIAPAAHFSVLPLCTPAGAEILLEENDDPVCDDPDGSDRASVHARLVDAVATLFERQATPWLSR